MLPRSEKYGTLSIFYGTELLQRKNKSCCFGSTVLKNSEANRLVEYMRGECVSLFRR